MRLDLLYLGEEAITEAKLPYAVAVLVAAGMGYSAISKMLQVPEKKIEKVAETPQVRIAVREIQQDRKVVRKILDLQDFKDFIAKWEGKRNISYPDSHGRSIGHGFFLNNDNSRKRIEDLGLDFDAVYRGDQAITNDQIDRLHTYAVNIAIRDIKDVFPKFSTYPNEVQYVLADMMFNLGRPRFMGFKNMIAAVNNEDWAVMAKEMKDSAWFGQVGGRSKHHYNSIISLVNSI
jgi:GH24 family phage-related lysozyme (muramidase)